LVVVDAVLVAGFLSCRYTGGDCDVLELEEGISLSILGRKRVCQLTVSVKIALFKTGAGADFGRAVATPANATRARSMMRTMLTMIGLL
jgi:hypothetical protein